MPGTIGLAGPMAQSLSGGAEGSQGQSRGRGAKRRAGYSQACIAPTERSPRAVFTSPGPQQPQSDTGRCWGLAWVGAREEAPLPLLGQEEACLPSAASPARAGSTSARAQIRGRKRAARMEEGPRRRNRTREEPNLQESRGRENRQCQPGSCGCRVSPPARPACDSGPSARVRASPQGSAAAPRLRGGYPGPTSHTARAPMRQKLGCTHREKASRREADSAVSGCRPRGAKGRRGAPATAAASGALLTPGPQTSGPRHWGRPCSRCLEPPGLRCFVQQPRDSHSEHMEKTDLKPESSTSVTGSSGPWTLAEARRGGRSPQRGPEAEREQGTRVPSHSPVPPALALAGQRE